MQFPLATLMVGPLDLSIIAVYMLGVVALGFYAGYHRMRKGSGGAARYFAPRRQYADVARHRPGDVRRQYLDGPLGEPCGIRL